MLNATVWSQRGVASDRAREVLGSFATSRSGSGSAAASRSLATENQAEPP